MTASFILGMYSNKENMLLRAALFQHRGTVHFCTQTSLSVYKSLSLEDLGRRAGSELVILKETLEN